MTPDQENKLLARLRSVFGKEGIDFRLKFSDHFGRNVFIWHPVGYPARRVNSNTTRRIVGFIKNFKENLDG